MAFRSIVLLICIVDRAMVDHQYCTQLGLSCHQYSTCIRDIDNDTITYSCECANGFSGNGSYCTG